MPEELAPAVGVKYENVPQTTKSGFGAYNDSGIWVDAAVPAAERYRFLVHEARQLAKHRGLSPEAREACSLFADVLGMEECRKSARRSERNNSGIRRVK